MLLQSSWLPELFICITTALFILYKFSIRKFDYWKNKGVYYLQPTAFFGNAFELLTFKKSIGHWFEAAYNKVDEPYFGAFIFDEPCLVVKCPRLIKQILVKDFNYFTDRTMLAPKHNQMIANIMFAQKSPDWKRVRPKISPVFTPAKLKGMAHLVNGVGLTVNEYISKRENQQIDAKELCAKYATDVIAKCAFGIDAYSLRHGEGDSDFRKIGKEFFEFRWKTALRQSAYFLRQDWAQALRVEFIESWASKYLIDVFWQAIKLREKTKIKANDLIDIIVEMRKDEKLCKEIDFEGDKVVAQATMFFAAGFETTASTMAFTLYEMSVNPDIQEKLRDEIKESIKEHGGITYDSLMKMKYLDMCFSETLRKYPALPFLDRKCNEDYKIPGTDIVIDKGIPVYIPMLGLHHDEKYFPDPEKYDPERFYDKSIYNEDGLSYLPFGEGPRNCLGARFGALSAKFGIAYMLSEFIIEKTADTPVPLVYEPKSLVLASKVGLPMKFRKI